MRIDEYHCVYTLKAFKDWALATGGDHQFPALQPSKLARCRNAAEYLAYSPAWFLELELEELLHAPLLGRTDRPGEGWMERWALWRCSAADPL